MGKLVAIVSSNGKPVARALVTPLGVKHVDYGQFGQVFFPRLTDDNGVVVLQDWTSPSPLPLTNIHLSVVHPGYLPAASFDLPAYDGMHDVTISVSLDSFRRRPSSQGRAPSVVGDRFMLDGQPWSTRGNSDFRLFARDLAGESIAPVLEERSGLGFNELREFGMNQYNGFPNTFDLIPRDQPDYFKRLPDHIYQVNRRGMIVEFVVFAGANVIMPDRNEQLDHYAKVLEALEPVKAGLKIELVNENDQGGNKIDAAAFPRPPAGFLFSRGSYGDSNPFCVEPVGDYGTVHPGRSPDWPRKLHNPMEDVEWRLHVPCPGNEIIKATSQESNPDNYRDGGKVAALLPAGATFHSDNGIQSLPFSDGEKACARAFVEGCLLVDLRFKAGQYTRSGNADCPVVFRPEDFFNNATAGGRIFARLLGDEACVVYSQWTNPDRGVEPIAPWTLVSTDKGVAYLRK